jgi:hypothetical protein
LTMCRKMSLRVDASYKCTLKLIYDSLKETNTIESSWHLEPFINILPSSVASLWHWNNLIQNNNTWTKANCQGFSLMDKPRTYADAMFTLLVSFIILSPAQPTDDLVMKMTETTLDAYRASTAGRHHRVGLLTRLLKVLTNCDSQRLYTDRYPDYSVFAPPGPINGHHPRANREALTAEETLDREIRDYTEFSMHHCLSDFEQKNLSNPEMFCKYIRERESLTPVWIDAGLRVFRFAHDV